ncbi:MAG: SHOCT domain-containing protein [Fidelibacterota bacterium]
MHWTGWGGGWLTMVSWWVLIILGIVFLVKLIVGQGSREAKGHSPLEIVKRRYAGGEITKEEFDQIKGDLSDA